MTFAFIRVSALATLLMLLNFMSPKQQESARSDRPSGRTGTPMSGAEMFKWYCAACHGKEGKGNGPAASELKVAAPDLTTLSKRNQGKFPERYVTDVLLNGANAPSHGKGAEMPVWGPLFEELNAKGKVTLRVNDVVEYIESIQSK